MSTQIHHDPDARRFTTVVDGHEAELTYRLQGQRLVIDHTGVPAPIEGRGIASALVTAAFDYARGQGMKVVPACAYASAYVQRHPEVADLVEQA